MKNLLYFYFDSVECFKQDYLMFDIDNCFFIHTEPMINPFLSRLFEKYGEVKSLSQIYDLIPGFSDFDESAQAIYVQSTSLNFDHENSILNFFKALLEIININHELIIDFSNCPSDLLPLLYFILLSAPRTNCKALAWDKNCQLFTEIPLSFPEPASRSFIRLIGLGYHTIAEMQREYIPRRVKQGLNISGKQTISQPTVSKYLTKLHEDGIIFSKYDGTSKKYFLKNPWGYLF